MVVGHGCCLLRCCCCCCCDKFGARYRDLRLGACCFGEAAMPGPSQNSSALRVRESPPIPCKRAWRKGAAPQAPRRPGAPAPGSGPEPGAGGNPRCPLGALWPTCPGVPPGYTRPAASLPYQGVCHWLRQPAEWTRRSVRWATDSAPAHHTPSASSEKVCSSGFGPTLRRALSK